MSGCVEKICLWEFRTWRSRLRGIKENDYNDWTCNVSWIGSRWGHGLGTVQRDRISGLRILVGVKGLLEAGVQGMSWNYQRW